MTMETAVKTDKMRRIEADHGASLEAIISDQLASGRTIYQIANHLGISQQTLYVWLDALDLDIVTTTRRELVPRREAALAR